MYKFLLIFILSISVGYSQEVVLPSVSISGSSSQNELENLVWNRYTTENFTILSIENSQGKWLNSNIERIKSWCLKRWGIQNFKFQKECRIMVVPNKDLLKKLFNISENRCEVRKIKNDVEIIAVWMVLSSEADLVDVVPYFVTKCSLVEFNYYNNFKNNFALTNGISLLNQSVNTIKKIKDEKINKLKILDLLDVDENKYKKMTAEEKKNFDLNSIVLCLMLKKEFGENSFLKFYFSNKNKEDSLSYVYNFNSSDFDKSYSRYSNDLINELKENKVPNSYIDIKKK